MELFNKDDTYTKEGIGLANRVSELFVPIINEYINKGCLPRDIKSIVYEEISFQTAVVQLDRLDKQYEQEAENGESTLGS